MTLPTALRKGIILPYTLTSVLGCLSEDEALKRAKQADWKARKFFYLACLMFVSFLGSWFTPMYVKNMTQEFIVGYLIIIIVFFVTTGWATEKYRQTYDTPMMSRINRAIKICEMLCTQFRPGMKHPEGLRKAVVDNLVLNASRVLILEERIHCKTTSTEMIALASEEWKKLRTEIDSLHRDTQFVGIVSADMTMERIFARARQTNTRD